MKAYIDEKTWDIVSMGVSYIRLSEYAFPKMSNFMGRDDKQVYWTNYYRFQDMILEAFRFMGVAHCEDYWPFVEHYMFGFSWDDNILHIDICDKYLHGELDNGKDIEWVESNFTNRNDVRDWVNKKESEMFLNALNDFFIRTNHR